MEPPPSERHHEGFFPPTFLKLLSLSSMPRLWRSTARALAGGEWSWDYLSLVGRKGDGGANVILCSSVHGLMELTEFMNLSPC